MQALTRHFFGSVEEATSAEPEESVILATNTENTAVTLNGQKFQVTDPRSISPGVPTFKPSEPSTLIGDLLSTVTSVPEPKTWGMLCGGLAALIVIGLRRKLLAIGNRHS